MAFPCRLRTGPHVPEAYRRLRAVTGRSEGAAVRREGHLVDGGRHRELPRAAVDQVVQADGPVLPARGKQFAVRAEGHSAYDAAVPRQRAPLLAAGHVPPFDGALPSTGRQGLAVGTELD